MNILNKQQTKNNIKQLFQPFKNIKKYTILKNQNKNNKNSK